MEIEEMVSGQWYKISYYSRNLNTCFDEYLKFKKIHVGKIHNVCFFDKKVVDKNLYFKPWTCKVFCDSILSIIECTLDEKLYLRNLEFSEQYAI